MVTPQKFKSRKRVTPSSIIVEDDDDDLKHFNSKIFEPKEIDFNRKAHSSPSKSMRHSSDLVDDNLQVIFLIIVYVQANSLRGVEWSELH